MFAVIKTGGKQYLIKEGGKIKVEKLPQEEKAKVTFKEVLLISDESAKTFNLGAPFVDKAKVEGQIVKHGRHKKITIIKHKPKKRYRVKKGHKQPYTEVLIEKIVG